MHSLKSTLDFALYFHQSDDQLPESFRSLHKRLEKYLHFSIFNYTAGSLDPMTS